MEESDVLIRLINQEQPVLKVSTLSSIASECGISYSEVVKYVHDCRSKQIDAGQCIIHMVKSYRPDLLNELKK